MLGLVAAGLAGVVSMLSSPASALAAGGADALSPVSTSVAVPAGVRAASAGGRSSPPGGIGRSGAERPPAARSRIASSEPPGGVPDWLLSSGQAEPGAARDPHGAGAADARRRWTCLLPPGSPGGVGPHRYPQWRDPAAVLRIPGRSPPAAV